MQARAAAPSLPAAGSISSSASNSHAAAHQCAQRLIRGRRVCGPATSATLQSDGMRQRRCRANAITTCLHKGLQQTGASASTTSCSSSMPASPEETTLELLTLLRKPADMQQLAPWMASELLLPPGTPIAVGGAEVVETGPLAQCARFMDAAARRVLPGHLLRRCRVLSSLTLGDECQQRVALTACTGEEVVLQWRLARCRHGSSGNMQYSRSGNLQYSRSGNAQHSNSPAASSSGWRLMAAQRDGSGDSDTPMLPLRPQPRASPELLLHAQLAALQAGDLTSAAGFTRWGRLRHAVSSSSSDVHMAGFKSLMRQYPYHQLLTHSSGAALGAAALPSQRTFVQEVCLHSACGSPSAHTPVFVWEMGMAADGCWVVDAITAVA